MGKEVERSSSSSSISNVPVLDTIEEFTWRVWRKRYSLTRENNCGVRPAYCDWLRKLENFANINDLRTSRLAMHNEVPG
jgi:hypothetical protein